MTLHHQCRFPLAWPWRRLQEGEEWCCPRCGARWRWVAKALRDLGVSHEWRRARADVPPPGLSPVWISLLAELERERR